MSSRIDRITQQRLEKLERLRAAGVNPYPYGYHRSHTTQEALALLKHQEESGQSEPVKVNVAGRITANRPFGKFSFMNLRDGAGKIQLYLFYEKLSEPINALLKEIDIGDIVGARGKMFKTRTGEPTIEVEDFTLLAKSLQPLPEKWHGLTDVEKRYRQRYLDLIANPDVKKLFQARSQIITGVRQFMNQRGFLEVEPPVLQPAAGGAMARPFITHHQALDRDLYLRIALELHLKRLIIGGFDRVYEIGRVFRNEGISIKHNPEFTMLESYEAYADYNDVMAMVEQMVSEVCRQVLGTEQVEFQGNVVDFKPPWKRVELRQAIIEHCGIDFEQFPDAGSLLAEMERRGLEADPKKDRGKLIDDLISTCVERNLIQPTILVDYPVEMSPLAKRKPGNDRLVERFEAYAGGFEIANAFTELNDPLDQRKRFIKQVQERNTQTDEEEETIDDDFLLAMEYGMPPTGGLGVGIDRLVMLLTNQPSIRDVILFPQLKEKGSGGRL